MGWNCRGWGWAAQSIVAIDVVTADGELRHCNAKENSEIFWSARGSGPGFFGVVTQFHLQSRPLPKALLASTYVYDAANEYDIVMPWVLETSRKAESNIEIVAIALYPDNTEDAPKDQRLQLVVHALTFTDTEEDARRYLKIFAETVPRKEVAKVIEYEKTTIAQEIIDQYKQNPTEHRYCCDNAWINNISAEQVSRAMRPVFVEIPSPQTFSLYFNMAPELPLQDMALSLQTEHYLAVYCIWKHARDDEKCMGWMRERFADMGKVSPGVYLGDSDFQIRPQPFLAEGRREKLEGYRKKYDPEGRFCAYLGLENENQK
jgi:FAD/FMN-containing dehydrogenase